MRSLFTPNRVAALSLVLAGLGAAAAAVTNSLPASWQATAVIVAGLIAHAGAALKFMEGSQRMDSHNAYASPPANNTPVIEAPAPDVAEPLPIIPGVPYEGPLAFNTEAPQHLAELDASPWIVMYDATSPSLPPGNAGAVAGYCDGIYANVWRAMVARYPALSKVQRVLSIAVFTSSIARIMDVESGNPTTPAEAAAWVKRMIQHGVYRPGVYASLSAMPPIIAEINKLGLKRSEYVLWVADWTGVPHLPAGYDACQYTNNHRANGADGPYDTSVCLPSFFPGAPKPPVPPVPPADIIDKAVLVAGLQVDQHTKQWKLTSTTLHGA